MQNITKELIEAYDTYIKLLGEELSELVPIAHVRGWRSSRYEMGGVLREKIEQLKKTAQANEPQY